MLLRAIQDGCVRICISPEIRINAGWKVRLP